MTMNRHSLILALCSGMWWATAAKADVITFSTAKAQGDQVTLAVSAGVTGNVTWDDGQPTPFTSDGSLQSFTVAGTQLTIETNEPVSSFYCADNALTDLDVSGAPSLLQLTCSGNQLTELKLTDLTLLEELNFSDNQLTSVSLTKNVNLVVLDCSHNQLTTLYTSSLPLLKSLNCSHNQLTSMSVSSNTQLEALWCYNNALTRLTLGGVNPVQVCAFNNALTALDLSKCANLKELWVDNNKLETLDVSAASVVCFSASNNELGTIIHNTADKKSMKYFYVENNLLAPYSLPTIASMTATAIAPQRPFYIVDNINVGETIDLSKYTRFNGWNTASGCTVSWENDAHEALVKGTDYTLSGAVYTFIQPQWKMRVLATSTKYPDVEFKSQWIRVIDPEGVESVNAQHGMEVYAKGGQLVVCNAEPMQVRVIHVSGRVVVDAYLAAGTHAWNLPTGVYVAGGKKVIVNK